MGEKHKPIEALVADVEVATEAWRNAERAESAARSETTACINRLNAAQRALDAALADLRKQAPRDSDWKRGERMRDARPVPEPTR